MHLTPAILESAYNYLRATPPFNKWKLPESDAVEFVVNDMRDHYGKSEVYDYAHDPKNTIMPIIQISRHRCAHTKHLIETMAHEMVHVAIDVGISYRERLVLSHHGTKFKRLAAQVCRAHGFDPKTF